MAKNPSKKKKAYDEYFEEMTSEHEEQTKNKEKFAPADVVVRELVWMYCPRCRGNSKTWSDVRPPVCEVCGYKVK